VVFYSIMVWAVGCARKRCAGYVRFCNIMYNTMCFLFVTMLQDLALPVALVLTVPGVPILKYGC
jgi:hypothetical protein